MSRGHSVCLIPQLSAGRGILLFVLPLLLAAGCGRKPPEVLFRYRFQPGEEFVYQVTLRGEGEVAMVLGAGEEDESRTVFPVKLEGGYLMALRVREVSPEGEAGIVLSYRDFDLTTTSLVQDREMSVRLTDDRVLVSEGDRVIRETGAGDGEFPLRGVVGEEFDLRVDERGTIRPARIPAPPEKLFPALRFESFLERMQPEFPGDPVPAGSTWSRTISLPGPGLQRHWDGGEKWEVRLDSTFRGFAEPGEEAALIDYTGDFEQSKPEEEPGPGLRGSAHHLSGTARFDLPRGRLISGSSTLRQRLEIRMPFEEVLRGRHMDFLVEDTVEVSVQLRQ